MKLTIGRARLHEAVCAAAAVSAGRSTLPILKHLLIEAEGDEARVHGTDLEIWIRAQAPPRLPPPAPAPAKVVRDVLAELPDGDVDLEGGEDGSLTLKAGTGLYELRGPAASEFPRMPEVDPVESVRVDGHALRRLIDETAFACSTGDTRPNLAGALFGVAGGALRMVATDTHRLAVSAAVVGGLAEAGDGDEPLSAIIPARALREIARMAAEREVVDGRWNTASAVFEAGDTVLITRLIDGRFPNFERVIPTERERALTVDGAELIGALRRVGTILPRSGGRRVVLTLTDEGALRLSAEADETGRGSEEIACQFEGDGLQMAFNCQYLLDWLSAVKAERVVLEATWPLQPAVLRPVGRDDAFYVVMPMAVE